MANLIVPSSREVVTEVSPNGTTLFSVTWYRFFDALTKLVVPSGDAPVSITVTASPFSYAALNNGVVIVRGGTVSLIELGRNGTFTTTGITVGLVPVSKGDTVRVTYAVLPTMTFVRS